MSVIHILAFSFVLLILSFFIYKKKGFKVGKIDRLIIAFGSLILTASSFLVVSQTIMGSILQAVYGWPHFLARYYIKDVTSGQFDSRWSFVLDKFPIYLITNFIFYFSIIIFLYFLIKLFIKSEKKTIVGLLVLIAVLSVPLLASQKIKELYIKQEIKQANYCEIDLDCKNALGVRGGKCPFGCYSYVNKSEAGRINSLINSFHSTCVYGCVTCLDVKCEDKKCQPVCEKNNFYQEIETSFDENDFSDLWRFDTFDNEKAKLIKSKFFSDNSAIVPFPKLEHVGRQDLKEYQVPEGFYNSWDDHYAFDEDQYDILLTKESAKLDLTHATYCIFKNKQKLFCAPMETGAAGPIMQAFNVDSKPAFTFRTVKKDSDNIASYNTWTDDNITLNEKYNLDGTYSPFSFQGNLGFIAEQEEKKSIYFNGKKVSQDFDEIRTIVCCATQPFPFQLHENGTLFFMAKRGEKYFFVEINLNNY